VLPRLVLVPNTAPSKDVDIERLSKPEKWNKTILGEQWDI
jgi:hypothetical protein